MANGSNKTVSSLTCRYCLSNSNEHEKFFLDKQDEYEKMLVGTFNIQIYFSENKYLCLTCLKRISKAAEIKKKILKVQKSLLQQSEEWIKLGSGIPKEESHSDYEEWGIEGRGDAGAGCRTGAGPKALKDEINCDIEACDGSDSEQGDNGMWDGGTRDDGKYDHKPGGKGKRNNDSSSSKNLIAMRKNTLIMLKNSNMCLFISKRTKYACYFCKDLFLDIKTLRVHSSTHKTEGFINQTIRQNRGLTMKNVDISNLECKICSHPCKDLDELRVHLKNNHGQAIEGTEHLLVPFKIEQGFGCLTCQKEFSNFLRLYIHMNCHSSYNVCEICGASFTNRIGLRCHIGAVHTEKKCTECPAVLPTASAKSKHLRKVHKISVERARKYCTQCDMIFPYKYKLEQHMVDKHGAKKRLHICEVCGKRFSSAGGVAIHYKGVHLRVRKHGCSVCDMTFFTSCDRKRHEITHGSDCPFACDVCGAKFRSKDSLRRHLKTKHGDFKNGG